MPQSVSKPPESPDELDELARSIREELRAAGFAPAFDPQPEELARLRVRARRARVPQRRARAVMILTYMTPALIVLGFALALRFLLPN